MNSSWWSTGGGYGVTIGSSAGVSETTQLRLKMKVRILKMVSEDKAKLEALNLGAEDNS